MNAEELKILKQNLFLTWLQFGRELRPEALALMADDLSTFGLSGVLAALQRYRLEDKTGRPPTIGQIAALLNTAADPHDIGVITAAKVLQSVSKFGYMRGDEARQFIGEQGWKAVQAFGGWLYICENLGVTIDVTTFQAQIREIIKSDTKLSSIDIKISLTHSGKESDLIKADPLKLLESIRQ